ncbi:hypothetical protein [Prauserella muralis]|uniref:hypothetical protein n=1 Tax=Prauserella muralis TaxID=588067 RepID=UPI0011AD9656|nr:hypothetical protein [Prauserella muralis]TWE29896.1 hypothetical protein FHX69_2588 [Prauserella muralis]
MIVAAVAAVLFAGAAVSAYRARLRGLALCMAATAAVEAALFILSLVFPEGL